MERGSAWSGNGNGAQLGLLLFKIYYGEEIWETEQKVINERESMESALIKTIGNMEMKYKMRPRYS